MFSVKSFHHLFGAPAVAALLACSTSVLPRATAAEPAPLTADAVADRFKIGVDQLNKVYWSPTLDIWLDQPGDDVRGHYEGRRNPPWWPSANAVETLLDFMKVTGCSDYAQSVENLYESHRGYRSNLPRIAEELKRRNQWSEADEKRFQRRMQKPVSPSSTGTGYYVEFRNEYLDDSGWWGVTWLKMYDRTKDAKYLTTAKAIHAHMAKNWRPDKGGGILWCEDEDKQKPNTITNNLFLILSARLYQRTKDEAFLHWAEQTLDWIHTNHLYDGTAVVDAPGHSGDYWSYNQGTFIGGLTALYQATGKQEYIDEAVQVADSVLTRSGLALPNGVLVEKLGNDGDACLFKGVFARYLAQLRDVLNERNVHLAIAQEIENTIRSSAASLIEHCSEAGKLYSAEWQQSSTEPIRNFNTQTAALAALVATIRDSRP